MLLLSLCLLSPCRIRWYLHCIGVALALHWYVVGIALVHCKLFDCKNYRYSLCYISDCSFTALSAVDHCMQWYTVVKLVNSQNLHSFKYDTCIIWMLSLAFSAVCTCIFWSHIRQITKMSSFIFCYPSTVVSIT